MKKQSGFAIVELLITIGITGVLLTVVMATFITAVNLGQIKLSNPVTQTTSTIILIPDGDEGTFDVVRGLRGTTTSIDFQCADTETTDECTVQENVWIKVINNESEGYECYLTGCPTLYETATGICTLPPGGEYSIVQTCDQEPEMTSVGDFIIDENGIPAFTGVDIPEPAGATIKKIIFRFADNVDLTNATTVPLSVNIEIPILSSTIQISPAYYPIICYGEEPPSEIYVRFDKVCYVNASNKEVCAEDPLGATLGPWDPCLII